MDTRDDLTKQYFNGRATVDMGGIAFEIGGRPLTDPDVIGLTGAPDGSAITVRQGDVGVELVARNPEAFDAPAEFHLIPIEGSGGAMLLDEVIVIREAMPSGFGLRLFGRQATAAAQLGIQIIVLEAAGSAISRVFNGYYTWPRFGFDAELVEAEIAKLPEHLAGAGTVADLMASEKGRHWWRANGSGRVMEFDLTPDSRSWQTLRAVLAEKGVRL